MILWTVWAMYSYSMIAALFLIIVVLNSLMCFFFFFIWHSEYAEKHDFQVVEIFVGHGVGRIFHSEPLIYHQCEYWYCFQHHNFNLFALLVEEVIANLLLVWLNFLELTVYVLESGNDRPGRMVENQTFTIGMYIWIPSL